MSLILVLGGTGTFGRLAVGDLLMRSAHDVAAASRSGIPDDNWPAGSEGRLSSHKVDVTDRQALLTLVTELRPSVILHAAGPYFKLGSIPLQVAIETQTPYIDLCPRSFRYRELELEFNQQAIDAGIPVFVGTSTVGGVTGLLTRRATARLDLVRRVETVLSVHNFGWGGGLVSDYLRTVSVPTPHGRPGSRTKLFVFPDDTTRRVALGDTLEHIPTDGLCRDTTHWFGLNSTAANLSMRLGERLAAFGLPVWYFAGPGGWLSGRMGGYRTDGILIHDAHGELNGESGVLRTTIVRPFGNIRNPSVLASIVARELVDAASFGTGFIHPASWMEPERIVAEFTVRANEVNTVWLPQATMKSPASSLELGAL